MANLSDWIPPWIDVKFNAQFSRNILLQLGIVLLVTVALLFHFREFLYGLYFENQPTQAGAIINSCIVGLFLAGLVRIAVLLLGYRNEEMSIAIFLNNTRNNDAELLSGIVSNRLIHERYQVLYELYAQRAPIEHGAIAAATLARESTRNSLPRFINNILILTGVFGTIVALSIALLGASSLLEITEDLTGMNLVIHGMSTAMSTTMTAIVCYLVFGYFYLRLSDAQTRLLGGLESATTLHLLPKFKPELPSLTGELTELVRELHTIANNLSLAQRNQAEIEQQLSELLQNQRHTGESMCQELQHIRALLRDGFRLPHH